MARKPKFSPGVGHNSDQLPDQSEYRSALAMLVLIDEEKKKQNERHKRLRKRVCESKGIAQEDIKMMFSRRDDALSDVVHYLKRTAHSLGAMFGKNFQLDMFSPDPENAEAIRFKGMISGASGQSGQAPPTLDNTERNIWLEGHKQGADARAAAQKEMADEFTEGLDGDYSEGALSERATGKAQRNPAAVKIGMQAASDFDGDQLNMEPTEDEVNFLSQSEKAQAARADAGIDF